ncbi:hypothetical protein CMO91_01030 [Candidatus Woesearchaeota archaeon]|nr:hypothetical protein [Candidatus Woesearchaeota archaeon]|tara:strand:+ start:582 stop:998 length:417 start_codon:yes stop_codon:yes gene_type:complete
MDDNNPNQPSVDSLAYEASVIIDLADQGPDHVRAAFYVLDNLPDDRDTRELEELLYEMRDDGDRYDGESLPADRGYEYDTRDWDVPDRDRDPEEDFPLYQDWIQEERTWPMYDLDLEDDRQESEEDVWDPDGPSHYDP